MIESHDRRPEDDDEQMLEEVLAHVKNVEPSLEARTSIRAAVAAELCRVTTSHRNRPLPWWRRTIPVPWPIAVSVAGLLLVVSASHYRTAPASVPSTVDVASRARSAERATDTRHDHTGVAMHTPDKSSELEYYATETYLCGIGRLSSESKSFIREK
jgi:hypothetical protein